jgi:iron complex outermembrane receptor protein
MNKRYLLLSASALCAGFHSSANAQNVAPNHDPAAPPEAVQAVPAERQSTQPGTGIADIVVTAQRRSESVQKSSLAIAVVGSQDLARQGVGNARDLASVLPNVSIAQAGPFVQTNIRGVGDLSGNALSQPAVSFSLDGVVINQGSEIGGNFFDLARVEVLKGPQGTLYGRNATGGAINLISNRPTHDFSGYITGEYGNYDSKRLTGAINVPISDTFAARLAFNYVDRDGYLSDGTDDDKRKAVRLQVLWNATPGISVRLYGTYNETRGNGGGAVLWPRQPGTGKWTSITDPINAAALEAGTAGLQDPVLPNSFFHQNVWSVGAEINAKLGDFATLTILPAYRGQKYSSYGYSTASFLINAKDNKDDQKSLEVRLSHEDERLKLVIGGFYFNDNTLVHFDTVPLAEAATAIFDFFNTTYDIPSYRNKSLAGFGETTYSLTDKFRVIGGIRYTRDIVSITGQYFDDSINPEPPIPLEGRKVFKAFSWRGGVEYDVGPQSLLFATASRGNKSGGFYAATPIDNSYKPEYLTAFTLGSRNRFFDNKLQVNLEAFYWQYRNQQLAAVGFTADGSVAYITRNAGSSNPRGVEADVIWQPTRSDTVHLTGAYTRAKFASFNIAYPAPLIAALRTGSDCRVPTTASAGAGGLPVYMINCAGAPVPRTPEFSGSADYQHVFFLGNDGKIAANAGGTFATSRYLTSDFFTPETRDKGYVLLNADLTYTAPKSQYSVTAFVRNITNHAVYQGAFSNVLNGFPALFGVSGTPTFVNRTIGPPRTYGVRATFNF